KVLSAAALILIFAGAAAFELTNPSVGKQLTEILRTPAPARSGHVSPPLDRKDLPAAGGEFVFPLFSEGGFETAGFGTANRFTGPIDDRASIEQVCTAIATRAQRGIDECLAELNSIPRDDPGRRFRIVRVEGSLIFLLMYQGKFDEAALWAERA